MYISFVVSPLMKYAFFVSLDEINGIFIPKFEYPLYILRDKIDRYKRQGCFFFLFWHWVGNFISLKLKIEIVYYLKHQFQF